MSPRLYTLTAAVFALGILAGDALASVPGETLVYVGVLTGLVCVAGFGVAVTVPFAVRVAQGRREAARDGDPT